MWLSVNSVDAEKQYRRRTLHLSWIHLNGARVFVWIKHSNCIPPVFTPVPVDSNGCCGSASLRISEVDVISTIMLSNRSLPWPNIFLNHFHHSMTSFFRENDNTICLLSRPDCSNMKTCKDIAWLFSFSLFLSLAYRSQSLPDSCVYDLNPKGIIDLTSIGRVDGTPAWKNIPPEKLDAHGNLACPLVRSVASHFSLLVVYSYNPCRPFTQSSCKDVASCQSRIRADTVVSYVTLSHFDLAFATDEKLAYSLGTQNSLQWKVVAGQDLPNLFYTSGERSLLVNLRCLDSGGPNKLDVYGHDSVTNYFTMTLSSKCACWDRCKGQRE